MTLSSTQLADSHALLMADWSEPIVLRQTTTTYDPATTQVEQTVIDAPLRAIPGPLVQRPSLRGAPAQPQRERTFIVSTPDLPPGWELNRSYVLHDGVDYAVGAAERSTQTGLTLLHAHAPA